MESGFGHVLENLKFDFSLRVLLIVLEFNSVFSKRIVVKMMLFCPYLGIKSRRELSIFGRSATSGNYSDAIETRTAAERFVDNAHSTTHTISKCVHAYCIHKVKHAQKHDIIHAHRHTWKFPRKRCVIRHSSLRYSVPRVEQENEFFDGEKDHDKDESVLDV